MKRGVLFIVLIFVSLISGILIDSNNAWGEGAGGSGTGGQGEGDDTTTSTNVKCTKKEAIQANKGISSDTPLFYPALYHTNSSFCEHDGKTYGGVSWHIFRVNNAKDICRRVLDHNKALKCVKESIGMSDPPQAIRPVHRNNDFTFEGVPNQCANAYYYAAFVQDGWYNKAVRDGKNNIIRSETLNTSKGIETSYKPVYYGPMAWNTVAAENEDGEKIPPLYNSSGATEMSVNEIVKKAKEGKGLNTKKLPGSCTTGSEYKACKEKSYKSSVADDLYKEWYGGNSGVPDGVGWFCLGHPILFQGRSTVASGDDSEGTAWISTGSEKAKILFIKQCPADGCKVKFTHEISKISDVGKSGKKSSYTIKRTINGVNTHTTSDKVTPTIRGVRPGGNNRYVTLKPGGMACETLKFDNGASSGSTTATTTACAIALGTIESKIDIKVKNESVSTYRNDFYEEVYAKPTDRLLYRATYEPNAQSAAKIIVDKMRINSGATIYDNNAGFQLQMMFNTNRGSLQPWNNAFNVSLQRNNSNSPPTHIKDYFSTIGDASVVTKDNRHDNKFGEVTLSDVGYSLDETAKVSANTATQTTPRKVTFSKVTDEEKLQARVFTTKPIYDTAYARVPYNYQNTTEITDDPSTKPLYAGEQASINTKITVREKWNNVTLGNYATRVDNARKGLEIRFPGRNGSVHTIEQPIGTIYTDGKTKELTNQEITFNVPDVPAGTEVCIRSIVFPQNSGLDTNWLDRNGNGQRQYSEEQKCFKVAKRPSIQIWGGNIYSAGDIEAKPAKKRLLAGYDSYNPKLSSVKYIFGSFGELGLVAGGKVTGFASGAGTGYAENNNGNLWPNPHPANGPANRPGNNNGDPSNPSNPGGGTKDDFCTHSTLSFANDKCSGPNGVVGDLGSSNDSTITKAKEDKESIIEELAIQSGDQTDYEVDNGFSINGRDPSHITSNGSYYYYSSENLDFAGGTIDKGTTQMVHSKEDITITNNVFYSTSETYSKLYDIPNMIIYAEENITIDCGVAQLDALIIAEKTVKTCDNDDYNDKNKGYLNSNQLRINGAVVAGKLVANRTYGAATGNNSIIPAEIINFNPALYLWNATNVEEGKNEDKNEIKDLDTVYLTEVAPRY